MQATSDFREDEETYVEHPVQDSFFIRSNHQLIRVKWRDIYWVHADGNYCYIVTADKKYAVKSSLKKLISRLPLQYFLRIHKSYIVRIDFIDRIDTRDNFVAIGEQMLPIGRMYKERLLEQLDII